MESRNRVSDGQSGDSSTAEERNMAANDRLQGSPYRAVRGVLCTYDDGILLLRGQVPSYYHKQLAQEAVAVLDGVTELVNEIKVVT